MGRMQSPREKDTVTVRVDSDLKQRYKESVDSMSDDLRTHIEQVAGAGEDDPLDDLDDRLTAAYRALRRHASPETHRVDVETGKSAVAEATRLNKGAVREAVLKPLEQKGYISPQWGTLVVYPPEALR
ncbi:hypothetical protein [Salinigranum sp. GCM10025319]|uniref:hypothetical protein n=1 Tax=Salinigranum sp. GCM10025319 TaxID=3252687 RepID=UPI003622D733